MQQTPVSTDLSILHLLEKVAQVQMMAVVKIPTVVKDQRVPCKQFRAQPAPKTQTAAVQKHVMETYVVFHSALSTTKLVP